MFRAHRGLMRADRHQQVRRFKWQLLLVSSKKIAISRYRGPLLQLPPGGAAGRASGTCESGAQCFRRLVYLPVKSALPLYNTSRLAQIFRLSSFGS